MNKRILTILISCIMLFPLVGCGDVSTVNVNIENSSQLNNTVLGKDALIEIGNRLYYDSTTRIVYWWNGHLADYRYDTVPTAYYAPNGLPYRYNPETNTFEEIQLN